MLILTGFGLGCMAVLFTIILKDFGRLPVARVFLALLIAASAFLLNGVVPKDWRWLTSDIMTMLPAIFWLLCQLAFSRRPQFKSLWSLVALYSFVAPALGRPFGASNELSGFLYLYAWKLPTYAEYIVILHGMWVVVANWSDDLIESRRKLRGALLSIVGLSALFVTGSLNTGHSLSWLLPAVVGLAAIIVSNLLLKGRKGVLLGPQAKETVVAEVSPASHITEPQEKHIRELEENTRKLREIMDKGFYRTEKLTLSMLSKEIGLPEYRTRALINESMDYRNFNDYINQLRIAEAGKRLIAEPNTPILNIALDVGYRTLSSFNRAFKEIYNQSPTNYRISNDCNSTPDA